MLVSCIMPTIKGREELIKLAKKCFDNQDYLERELVIVEDEGTIGHKLNLGCERGKGSILIRWDDDDWSSPTRITDQINRLLVSKKSLTGYNEIYFWNTLTKTASWYRGARNYCLGASMCFIRSFWEANHFLDASYGEDLEFYKKAKAANDVIAVPAEHMLVARIHGTNTSSAKIKFPPVPIERLPKQFFDDLNGG